MALVVAKDSRSDRGAPAEQRRPGVERAVVTDADAELIRMLRGVSKRTKAAHGKPRDAAASPMRQAAEARVDERDQLANNLRLSGPRTVATVGIITFGEALRENHDQRPDHSSAHRRFEGANDGPWVGVPRIRQAMQVIQNGIGLGARVVTGGQVDVEE